MVYIHIFQIFSVSSGFNVGHIPWFLTAPVEVSFSEYQLFTESFKPPVAWTMGTVPYIMAPWDGDGETSIQKKANTLW